MASFPLPLPHSSCCYRLPPSTFKLSKSSASILPSPRSALNQRPPHFLRRLRPSLFTQHDDVSMVFPKYINGEHKNAAIEYMDALKVIPTVVGINLLMIAPPADAAPLNLPFDLPENWLEIFFIVASFGFIYLLVIPLFLYYYLERRWFKRKMAEAILQFGLVFLFFPGMLLLAPFINFRSFPQDGAKEPWDEIRP